MLCEVDLTLLLVAYINYTLPQKKNMRRLIIEHASYSLYYDINYKYLTTKIYIV